MNPGYSHPDVVAPVGPVDPQISLVSVRSRDGRPIALLANYSLHYVGGVPAVSADYFGEFAQRMTRLIGATQTSPPFVAMMSNGTSADVNNVNYALSAGPKRAPFEQIQIVAESVAQAALPVYRQIVYQPQAVLGAATREVELRVRKPSPEERDAARQFLADTTERPLKGLPAVYQHETARLADYPDTVAVVLQALRLGDLGIVASPCETFTETGLALKASTPFRHTFTIELANGYFGYLPTPQQHRWGGYETWRARSSFLAADAEPQVRMTLWDLLQQLKP
jgi:hypothetical protein